MIEVVMLSALAVGLVEAVKTTNRISNQYLPVVAIVIGLCLSFLMAGTYQEIIVNGLVIGLSSVGLYDVSKKSILGK